MRCDGTEEREDIVGFRLRKSINLGGGFRINISKSGVGYSWGVPGYRITKTAKGSTRTTYSIPGTGLSYTEEHQKSGNKKGNPHQTENAPKNTKILDSGDIKKYQTAEYHELLEGIENYKKWNRISTILILTILLAGIPIFILSAIAGVFLKIYVKKNLSIPMEYTFDKESLEKYEHLKKQWISLNSSVALWQLTLSSSTNDKKHNAGAANLVSREKIKITEGCPKFFRTDMKYILVSLKNESLVLMPDKILILKGKNVGAISYENLRVHIQDYRFIEEERVPSDAEIIDHTWAKVNKDGSPDKRFKGNRKLPICRYGLIRLSSNSGMDIRICCSNNKLLQNFN